MEIKSHTFDSMKLQGSQPNTVNIAAILPGEIESVQTELIAMRGVVCFAEDARPDVYDVLLTIQGQGRLDFADRKFSLEEQSIVRVPHAISYQIACGQGQDLYLLRIRKILNANDQQVIRENSREHAEPYVKRFSECPAYTESIKSAKTVSRMLLPERKVPRFCMGNVRTEGPDKVDSHEHAMLEQLFLGLPGCRCTCKADGQTAMLVENMLLHIPLGSTHSVSVDTGDVLYYVWLDFFLTAAGEKYMDEQHTMLDEHNDKT